MSPRFGAFTLGASAALLLEAAHPLLGTSLLASSRSSMRDVEKQGHVRDGPG